GLRNAEEVFLTWLIQDIGMLALTRTVEGLYADLPEGQANHQAVIRRERERVGTEHAAVGGWLLKRWSFPDSIEQCVAASHDPAGVPRIHSNAAADRCGHVSSAFAEVLVRGGEERTLQSLAGLAQQQLAMSKDRLGQVIHSVRAMLPEIESAFDTRLDVDAQ